MNKRIPNKGRSFCSLLVPLNASLLTSARKKSPKKSPSRKLKKGKSYGGKLCSDKAESVIFSVSCETQSVSKKKEEPKITTPENAAEPAPQLRSKQERGRKNNSELTVRKYKNTKSRSYGGILCSDKTRKTSSSGSWEETKATSTALEGHNVTAVEEAAESALRLQSKLEWVTENSSELTVRKSEELSKSGSERHSHTSLVVQQNEAGLPKIDKQTNGEDTKPEELSNQTNSFNEKPNQPKCSSDNDFDFNPVVCDADSVSKNIISTNFRNKRLDRELNAHDKARLKLSKATKLTGTINKERRNIERQQEKNLKNVTVRRKHPIPTIELSNETIRFDDKKKICSSTSSIKKPFKRKKMPDFSAIHQQNFGKMESIVDHLDRKARRAIVLTTSTVKKAKPNLKKESSEKKSIVKHLGRTAQRALVLTPLTTRKASLDMTESNSKKVSKSTYFAVRQQPNSKCETATSTNDAKLKCVQNLDSTFEIIKSDNESTKENIINTVPQSDTNFDEINAKEKVKQQNVSILRKVEVSKPTVEELNSRMLEKRRLYKGKIEAGGETRQKKNVEILRGVRSNRRFELQMKYRNNQK